MLYEQLIKRLMDTGLTQKEAEHLFVLAVEDVVVKLDEMMLKDDENFISMISKYRGNSWNSN